jgi:hypothetical protein
MIPESSIGVLLLSTVPEAHVMLLRELRGRGIPVQVARSARHAVRKLRQRPVLILVDLTYGPALDRASIERVNSARGTSTVLAMHEGDLGRFAEELENLVVDGFCRTGEWTSIVELASESFSKVIEVAQN